MFVLIKNRFKDKFMFQFYLMFKCEDHYVFEVQTVLKPSADVKVLL